MRPILSSLMVAVMASAMVFSQSQRQATIQSIIGSVKVRKGNAASWKDARPKMPIAEKDAIRTFVESQVEIITSEGSVIKLDENTTLEMSSYKEFPNGSRTTKVSIFTGTVLSNVKKLVNTGSKFEFETPTATAAIRGTEVGLEVTSEKTSVKVYEGEVMVTPRGALRGVSIKTNQMTTIVKGQKTVSVEALKEKQKKVIGKPDSTHADTAHIDTSDSNKAKTDSLKQEIGDGKGTQSDTAAADAQNIEKTKDSLAILSTVTEQKVPLSLTVTSPNEGQTFTNPMIPVSGTTTPGAEVFVNGSKCQISPLGSFSMKVPIPDEENTILLDIEASLKGDVRKISRQISYKPVLTFSITSPQNQQTVNSTSVPVAGQVTPIKADVFVLDTKIPIAGTGRFSGLVTIPDEEGRVDLNFEASYQGSVKREIRTIVYKRIADINKPTIQPTQLPRVAPVKTISFTVFDKTTDDEITFYTTVDGSMNTEVGQPNSNFTLELMEGVHHYTVYAEDKTHNRTQVVSGDIGFLKARPLLQVRKPAHSPEIIHIPPGTPHSSFRPIYTVEFSILNLPDNDMRLIREASCKNESTGQLLVQKDLIDLNLYFDIELRRGENRLTIKVKDINDNEMQYSSPIIIDVR